MKKVVFIIICIACVLATFYMGMTCRWAIERDDSTINIAIRIVATLAWALITYRVVSKKDKWIQKTFK